MNDAQVRENVLDEAKKCVLHDRNSTYGKPEDNFNRIAILWDAYDKIRKPGPETPTDVAIKMALMKIARLAHNPTHKDSWVDGIGYLACGAGIELAEPIAQDGGNEHIQAAIKHIAEQERTVHVAGIGDCVITKESDIEDFRKIADAINKAEFKLWPTLPTQARPTQSSSSVSLS
jgi:hypothetical protein